MRKRHITSKVKNFTGELTNRVAVCFEAGALMLGMTGSFTYLEILLSKSYTILIISLGAVYERQIFIN